MDTTPHSTPPPKPRSRWFRAISAIGATLLRIFAVAIGLGLTAFSMGYVWLDENILSNLPRDLSDIRAFRPLTSVRVFDQRELVVDEFYLERRIWVPKDELPAYVGQAFIAAEDRRFYQHPGVDPQGILRALIVNLQSQTSSQGGSTITQQLVKNLLVGKQRSYERKLKEAVLAIRLDQELTKDEVLQLYLNYVALGSGNYGVEAAARDYFGVSARDLDVGQAALLAGIVPAPSRYGPRASRDLAAHRRTLVLRAMVEEGYIRPEVAARYEDDPVLITKPPALEAPTGLSYDTTVRREIRRLLGDRVPFELGLQIHTPYDQRMQEVATKSVRTALEEHAQRHGFLVDHHHLALADTTAFLLSAAGLTKDPETGESLAPVVEQCFEALVPASGDLGALQAGTRTFALDAASRNLPVRAERPEQVPPPLRETLSAGDVLSVCANQGGDVRAVAHPWAEGAAIVLDNATGDVLALVGGYSEALEGFVRATQARRQPGSSFKPYVYATALLDGHSQLDVLLDGPIAMPAGGGKVWSPQNYGGGYFGPVQLRTALAKSLNTVSVRLTLEAGAADVARVAHALGVRTPLRVDPTLALGSSEVTPLDQALGYAAIARGGQTVDPVYIQDIRDAEGALLASAGGVLTLPDGTSLRLPGGPGERALPEGVSYELLDMMREVVHSGTARRAWDEHQDRAGKTGTTNGYVDAWFVGFTPRHTIAVWIGTDGQSTLGDSETGGHTALPAWLRIAEALQDPDDERFAIPPDAMLVKNGDAWVGLARGKIHGTWAGPQWPDSRPLPAFGSTH